MIEKFVDDQNKRIEQVTSEFLHAQNEVLANMDKVNQKMTTVLQLEKTLTSNVVATKRLIQENKEIKAQNLKRVQKIEETNLNLDEKLRCIEHIHLKQLTNDLDRISSSLYQKLNQMERKHEEITSPMLDAHNNLQQESSLLQKEI